MEENQPINFQIQSLVNQIAEYSLKVATKDEVIAKQKMRIRELEKELNEYRQKEIEKMNQNAE